MKQIKKIFPVNMRSQCFTKYLEQNSENDSKLPISPHIVRTLPNLWSRQYLRLVKTQFKNNFPCVSAVNQ